MVAISRNSNNPLRSDTAGSRTPPGKELVGRKLTQRELDVLVRQGADDVLALTGHRPEAKAKLAQPGDFAKLVRQKFGVRYDTSWREYCKAWVFEPFVQMASLRIAGWYDCDDKTISFDVSYIPNRPWDGLRKLIFHELIHVWQHECYPDLWLLLDKSYRCFYAQQNSENGWQLYSLSALVEGHAVCWDARARRLISRLEDPRVGPQAYCFR